MAPVLPVDQPDRFWLVEDDDGDRDADVRLGDGRLQVAGRGGGQDERDHRVDVRVGREQLKALLEVRLGDGRGGVDGAADRAAW